VVDCKERLEGFLREDRVPFEVQHHPRAVTAQEVAASEHVPGKMLAKTVMVLADGEMWSCWPCPPRTRWTLRRRPRRLGLKRRAWPKRRSLRTPSRTAKSAGLAGYLSIDALRGVYTSIPQRCAERVIHPDYGTLPSKLLYVLVKSAGKAYSDMEQRFKAECGS
jgi:hypothetical protein